MPTTLRMLAALFILNLSSTLSAANCGQMGVALQVLGSGGPVADDDRASSGYLIWQDGRARILVEAGGGIFLRYGQARAQIEDLDLIALTHFHTDHAADLPALLKSGFFSSREAALHISGPSGNTIMPSIQEYLSALFSAEHGAFRYLSGFLDGSDGLFALHPIEIDADKRKPFLLYKDKDLKVYAVGVHHGPIPSLGYLFEIDGKRIAISGDQNLADNAFVTLAKHADVMLMPMAIPNDAGSVARNLHATPDNIGKAALQAAPQRLILSHLMQRSLRNLDDNLDAIRQYYQGKMIVAQDMACYELSD